MDEDDTALSSTDKFLSSRLRYTTDAHAQEICLLQSGDTEIGVMMGWERGIMQETVRRMGDGHPNVQTGLRVLNVGFGLGIIDSYFQALAIPPSTHVIIEPHPDVLRHMRERGWYDKKGVIILEGKWQDFVVGTKTMEDMVFDIVYTDTFSEEYEGEIRARSRAHFTHNSTSRFASILRPCSETARRSRRPVQLLQRVGSHQ